MGSKIMGSFDALVEFTHVKECTEQVRLIELTVLEGNLYKN